MISGMNIISIKELVSGYQSLISAELNKTSICKWLLLYTVKTLCGYGRILHAKRCNFKDC